MRVIRTAAAVLALLTGGFALAQNAPPALKLQERVDLAVKKGAAHLASKQRKDGSFDGQFPGRSGETALVLLALLKSGVDANDPRIQSGFDWLLDRPLMETYDVSLALMALEARYTPPPEVIKERNLDRMTVVRRVFQVAAPPRDRKYAEKAVKWLLDHRTPKLKMWRYPSPDSVDNSVTQFAVMGLKAGGSLGVDVPKEVYLDVLDYFLETQEKDGPEVKRFAVPAADKAVISNAPQGAPGAGKPGRGGKQTGGGPRDGRGSRVREPEEDEEGAGPTTTESGPFKARGWSYVPPSQAEGGAGAAAMPSTGAMTAAGLSCLILAKAELDQLPGWVARYGGKTSRGIRDGSAWLAHHFRVDGNPGGSWPVYYLYGLERSGVLAGVVLFGEHDWYVEGSEQLLQWQGDDGSWDQDQQGTLVSTSFALLFLTRATPPAFPVEPERPTTGGNRGGAPDGKQ